MITYQQMLVQVDANLANRAAFDRAIAAGRHLGEVTPGSDGGFFARMRHRRAVRALSDTMAGFVNELVDASGNPLSEEDRGAVCDWLAKYILATERVRYSLSTIRDASAAFRASQPAVIDKEDLRALFDTIVAKRASKADQA